MRGAVAEACRRSCPARLVARTFSLRDSARKGLSAPYLATLVAFMLAAISGAFATLSTPYLAMFVAAVRSLVPQPQSLDLLLRISLMVSSAVRPHLQVHSILLFVTEPPVTVQELKLVPDKTASHLAFVFAILDSNLVGAMLLFYFAQWRRPLKLYGALFVKERAPGFPETLLLTNYSILLLISRCCGKHSKSEARKQRAHRTEPARTREPC